MSENDTTELRLPAGPQILSSAQLESLGISFAAMVCHTGMGYWGDLQFILQGWNICSPLCRDVVLCGDSLVYSAVVAVMCGGCVCHKVLVMLCGESVVFQQMMVVWNGECVVCDLVVACCVENP